MLNLALMLKLNEIGMVWIKLKRYYLINYLYGEKAKEERNQAIEEHPLSWQKEANRWYPGRYVLKDWKEISKEEFEKFGGDRLGN